MYEYGTDILTELEEIIDIETNYLQQIYSELENSL